MHTTKVMLSIEMVDICKAYSLTNGWIFPIDEYVPSYGDLFAYQSYDPYCIKVWMCNGFKETLYTTIDIHNYEDIKSISIDSNIILCVDMKLDIDAIVSSLNMYLRKKLDIHLGMIDSPIVLDAFKIIIKHVDNIKFLMLMKVVCTALRKKVHKIHPYLRYSILVNSRSSVLRTTFNGYTLYKVLTPDMHTECSLYSIGDHVKVYKCEKGFVLHREMAIYKMLECIDDNNIITNAKALDKIDTHRNAYICIYEPRVYFIRDYRLINKYVSIQDIIYNNIIPTIYRGDIVTTNVYNDDVLGMITSHSSPLSIFFLFDDIESFIKAFEVSNYKLLGSIGWFMREKSYTYLCNEGCKVSYTVDCKDVIRIVTDLYKSKSMIPLFEIGLEDHAYVYNKECLK